MIATVVAITLYLIDKERSHAYEAAVRNGDNLSRIFQQHLERTIGSADQTLRLLRKVYLRDQGKVDLAAWTSDPALRNDLVMQVGIVGPDGFLKMSSAGP